MGGEVAGDLDRAAHVPAVDAPFRGAQADLQNVQQARDARGVAAQLAAESPGQVVQVTLGAQAVLHLKAPLAVGLGGVLRHLQGDRAFPAQQIVEAAIPGSHDACVHRRALHQAAAQAGGGAGHQEAAHHAAFQHRLMGKEALHHARLRRQAQAERRAADIQLASRDAVLAHGLARVAVKDHIHVGHLLAGIAPAQGAQHAALGRDQRRLALIARHALGQRLGGGIGYDQLKGLDLMDLVQLLVRAVDIPLFALQYRPLHLHLSTLALAEIAADQGRAPLVLLALVLVDRAEEGGHRGALALGGVGRTQDVHLDRLQITLPRLHLHLAHAAGADGPQHEAGSQVLGHLDGGADLPHDRLAELGEGVNREGRELGSSGGMPAFAGGKRLRSSREAMGAG
ncbi:hypothetical protein SDC9_126336 [bioreactor metagenome]|uniref:Uncharacterized protein n=1 Tax=bioreactor metagenome TaxID=1076179 RepID=A0A645CQV3_9ZZZZ